MDNKNILITGAAGGFGSELALQLGRLAIKDGYELILLDNNEAGLDQLADRIQADCDYEPLIYPFDLETSNIDQYQEMVTVFENQLSKLDFIIHTAARFNALAPTVHADPVEWLRILQTNLNGPWLLSRCCVPLLKQAGNSRLIFMLEDLATMREPNWGSYGVSKIALSALVDQLKAELIQDGIQVAGVNPGPMRTSLRTKAWMPSSDDPAQPVENVATQIVNWMLSADSLDELNLSV